MIESTPVSESAPQASAQPSPQEIAEVISELEQYRERLIADFMTTAKKAKLPKSTVTAQLENHPEIAKIDASLAQLREASGSTSVSSTVSSTEE
jgi:hypothetical protein